MTATSFTSLGTNSPATGATTVVLTITANVNIGDNVFVVAANDSTTADNFTFSDSQGNTYIRSSQVSITGRTGHAMAASQITHAMTSGVDTITCTFASGSRNNRVICAWIETTPGFTNPLLTASDTPSDGASSASYSATTANVGTKTPTSNPDLIILTFSIESPGSHGAITNFTQRFDFFDSSSLNTELVVFANTNLTTTNAASAPTMTLTPSQAGVGFQAIFKYQGNPTTAHLLGLTGVGK